MPRTFDLVRKMWSAFREGGVEAILPLLAPDVEFVAADGTEYRGHEGVRTFFAAFEEQGRTFDASPYSFEGHGEAVLASGHSRIHSARGTTGTRMYVLHVCADGMIVRISGHGSRDAALAELRRFRSARDDAPTRR